MERHSRQRGGEMSDPQTLKTGDIVRHHIYGDGTVRQVQPSSGGMQYRVEFGAHSRWLFGDGLKIVKAASRAPKQAVKAGA